MTKIVSLTTRRIVKLGPDKGASRLYEAHAFEEGYPVYKIMPQPKVSDDVEVYVDNLDDLWGYIAKGHRSRFICNAVPKSAPSVLGIEEGNFLLEVAKS